MKMELHNLSIDERIRLVEDIWDSIAADQGVLPLTDEQKAELDQRLDIYELDIKHWACSCRSDSGYKEEAVSLKVHIRPKAEKDIETAATWYERQQKGLGKDFLDEVLGVFETISKRPNIFSVVHRETRRAIVHRFPTSTP